MAPQVGLEPTTLRLTVATAKYHAIASDSSKYLLLRIVMAFSSRVRSMLNATTFYGEGAQKVAQLRRHFCWIPRRGVDTSNQSSWLPGANGDCPASDITEQRCDLFSMSEKLEPKDFWARFPIRVECRSHHLEYPYSISPEPTCGPLGLTSSR